MDKSNSSQELSPLKSLITGILISMLLTLFLYCGVTLSCKYLIQVTVSLIGIIIISSFIFWINIKHDYMSDLTNIISSTVAFDYRFSRPQYVTSISNVLKRINPYIGLLVTLSGMLLLLWILPAFIINLLTTSETSAPYLSISVFLMSSIICSAYFFSNRDQFTKIMSKTLFFAGILMGTTGVLKMLIYLYNVI